MRRNPLTALLVLLVTTAGAPGQSFGGLGDLPGGMFASYATGISADGVTVTGVGYSALGPEAFRWTEAGGMVGLGDLPGGSAYSEPFGISDDGTYIVGQSSSAQSGVDTEAFRWSASLGLQGLGDLPGGNFHSEAHSVSAEGVVVGSSNSQYGGDGFTCTPALGMVRFAPPPSVVWLEATGISADAAHLAGTLGFEDHVEAFLWNANTGFMFLGDLPGGTRTSSARAISRDGQVVVGESVSGAGYSAFRWMPQFGMEDLGDLPGGTYQSGAYACSADGSVVVGQGSASAGSSAFVWDPQNGMQSVKQVLQQRGVTSVSNWTLTTARGVSGDGHRIVGIGFDPMDREQAWLADLGGEPTPCEGDLDHDGSVGLSDLTRLLANFGRTCR